MRYILTFLVLIFTLSVFAFGQTSITEKYSKPKGNTENILSVDATVQQSFNMTYELINAQLESAKVEKAQAQDKCTSWIAGIQTTIDLLTQRKTEAEKLGVKPLPINATKELIIEP